MPPKMLAVQQELEDHALQTDGRFHVFTLYLDQAAVAAREGYIWSKFREVCASRELPGSTCVCVKCGLVVQRRGWKQTRDWPCRARSSLAHKRFPSGKEYVKEWEMVEDGVQFLEARAACSTSLTTKQRRVLDRSRIAINMLLQNRAEMKDQPMQQADSVPNTRPKRALGNGGRRLSIATLNIGSLSSSLDGLADVVALQETMVGEKQGRSVRQEAHACNLSFFQGVSSPLHTDTIGRGLSWSLCQVLSVAQWVDRRSRSERSLAQPICENRTPRCLAAGEHYSVSGPSSACPGITHPFPDHRGGLSAAYTSD